jgi:hypothetical protein
LRLAPLGTPGHVHLPRVAMDGDGREHPRCPPVRVLHHTPGDQVITHPLSREIVSRDSFRVEFTKDHKCHGEILFATRPMMAVGLICLASSSQRITNITADSLL